MCGLVGAVAQKNVTPVLLEALQRLEYRGYDSAGIAVVDTRRHMHLRRQVGKVNDLSRGIRNQDFDSRLGIGHTRWATHGEPTERNAHPHVSNNEVAVVHNGIIENHETLRKELEQEGYHFESDTDSEVIAHLIHQNLCSSSSLLNAVHAAIRKLNGAYAIAVLAVSEPETLVAARSDSPLVIGVGESEMFVASDVAALLPMTRRFVFLEEGDVAELQRGNISILDHAGNVAVRPMRDVSLSSDVGDKNGYRHFMLKEIHEQPQALTDTLKGRISGNALLEESLGFKTHGLLERVRHVHIAACGTSNHAGQVARYWLESLTGLPCTVELASEYRYRSPVVPDDSLFISVSQSGETADTLAALRHAKSAGYLATMGVCNVPECSLVRESDLSLITRAGPEMGVASTKAFTTQLLSLLMICGMLSRHRRPGTERNIVDQLKAAAKAVDAVLDLEEVIARRVAASIELRQHALFLGRGPLYPIAQEGALKLKEISYIHAEAYAAGELKHGPLALVDAEMPVIAVAPKNEWLPKLKSNLREVAARRGELFVFTDAHNELSSSPGMTVIEMPPAPALITPIVYVVALQLLAYHTAVIKGTDVDRPRNLAKSVTVE